jgi:hypothetical protein
MIDCSIVATANRYALAFVVTDLGLPHSLSFGKQSRVIH